MQKYLWTQVATRGLKPFYLSWAEKYSAPLVVDNSDCDIDSYQGYENLVRDEIIIK